MDSTHIYTVYRALNTINGKVYIGFDSAWPQRKTDHLYRYKTPRKWKSAFYDAITQYGPDAFVWDVIYQSVDYEHTKNVMEPYFITEHHSFGNGYNMTAGGEGTRGKKHRPEVIEKFKAAKSGENNPCWGRKQSQEEITKRLRYGPDNKHYGRKQPTDHVLKAAAARKRPSEPKPEIKRLIRGRSILVDGIEYRSQAEAARAFGISKNAVGNRLKSDNYPGWIQF
jgi:group I intron endonuclease